MAATGRQLLGFWSIVLVGLVGGQTQTRGEESQQFANCRVFFLQGIATSLAGGNPSELPTRFATLHGALAGRGFFEGGGNFFVYSYKGGEVRQSDGVWIPAAYNCLDTGQCITTASPPSCFNVDWENTSTGRFEKMLNDLSAHSAHSSAKFYLVGHSLGGYIAFNSLLFTRSNIAMVVTVDSPLEGISTCVSGWLSIAKMIGLSGSCPDLLGRPAVEYISRLSSLPGLRSANSSEAKWAMDAGVVISNYGNNFDGLYNPPLWPPACLLGTNQAFRQRLNDPDQSGNIQLSHTNYRQLMGEFKGALLARHASFLFEEEPLRAEIIATEIVNHCVTQTLSNTAFLQTSFFDNHGVCEPGGGCENDCSVCGEEGITEGDCLGCVPAVSTWGLTTLGLLTLTAGTIVLRRRRFSTEV